MAAYKKIRKARLPEIIDILTHETIRSQAELSKQLTHRGYNITQATLSRDLKLLKATKKPDEKGVLRYVVGQAVPRRSGRLKSHATRNTAHSAISSLALSGNIAVIKTRNGYASGLAFELDLLESPMILGTIPGADTVMIVLEENTERTDFLDLLSTIMPAGIVDAARALYIKK